MSKHVVPLSATLLFTALATLVFAGAAAAEEAGAPSLEDQVIQEKCTLCHSSKRIYTTDPAQLKETLQRMQKKNPEWITDLNSDHIAEVLTKLLADPSVASMRRAWLETVDRGEKLFGDEALGTKGVSCASCHGDTKELAGVHDAYPQYDPDRRAFVTLEDRVNLMIVEQMGGEGMPRQDPKMTNLVAYLKSLR